MNATVEQVLEWDRQKQHRISDLQEAAQLALLAIREVRPNGPDVAARILERALITREPGAGGWLSGT